MSALLQPSSDRLPFHEEFLTYMASNFSFSSTLSYSSFVSLYRVIEKNPNTHLHIWLPSKLSPKTKEQVRLERCVSLRKSKIDGVDSSVPLMHHDPSDLGLICLVKKRKIRFRILSDLRIQSWIFLKKRPHSQSMELRAKVFFFFEAHHIKPFFFSPCIEELAQKALWFDHETRHKGSTPRGIFFSDQIFMFLWGPEVGVTCGCSWKSGDYICLTSRLPFSWHVLPPWTGRVQQQPDELFLVQNSSWNFAFKNQEVRFHKQLHDYKELQLSSGLGKYIRYYILVSYACHAKCLEAIWRNPSVRYRADLDYHCLTVLSLEAKCFRISSDANIIYKTSLVKLGLKTVNGSTNACSIDLGVVLLQSLIRQFALFSETLDQGPIATINDFFNTVSSRGILGASEEEGELVSQTAVVQSQRYTGKSWVNPGGRGDSSPWRLCTDPIYSTGKWNFGDYTCPKMTELRNLRVIFFFLRPSFPEDFEELTKAYFWA